MTIPYSTAYYRKNRDRINARRRAKRSDETRAYHRAYYAAKVKRRYRFGISDEDFAERLAAQGGKCAICGATEPGGRGDWALDHAHEFPKRDPRGHRGIVCTRCNVMLGMALDNPETLCAGAAYLAQWTTKLLA